MLETTDAAHPPVRCDHCGTDFKINPDKLSQLGESEGIRMELLAVRPDMFDAGGLGRALRQYQGEQMLPSQYHLNPPQRRVTVDAAVAQPESFRPHIACVEVRGVTLDDETLRIIMKLQENLHWALGRDRKRASIGVYDLDTLKADNLHYGVLDPDAAGFCPLGIADGQVWSGRRILAEHPKGVGYKHLLEQLSAYPLLSDESGQVLSMPPIINSESTRVRPESKNLFIDVTGPEARTVEKTLNILAANIAELLPGAELFGVEVHYADRRVVTPDLTPQEVRFDGVAAKRLIGVDLDDEAMKDCLLRMGYGVESLGGHQFNVAVPAWRNDILHPMDLVEDVAIAYGYHNIEAAPVTSVTVAKERPVQRHFNLCRQIFTGLGFFEAITLILSSEDAQYERMGLPEDPERVTIDNPISVEQTQIRTALLPGLLETFSINTDQELPQQIFEVGNVSFLDPKRDTGARERSRLAVAAIGPKVDFSQIKAVCEAFAREHRITLRYEAANMPFYLPGRGARLSTQIDGKDVVLGHIGEIHPLVLENFNLSFPTAAMEINLDPLQARI
ncbi:putative Phenylalanyl-tRNA synthetase subunit beta [Magnetofaba australis IT-1]|uniref:phenylalanine--tRNA ligase n=1 Tax=Magnetofaba australis IT-1 TaxID=1434232 RepID=A0A1Y2K525_9PROT|nr:putative Phenylalanyl-tRNA synthetase subunit beta [Magnetofaba australis IT-1]